MISNLQDDLEDGIEIDIIKENFIRINEKTVEILDTLKEKIVSEKEGLKDKYCRI